MNANKKGYGLGTIRSTSTMNNRKLTMIDLFGKAEQLQYYLR